MIIPAHNAVAHQHQTAIPAKMATYLNQTLMNVIIAVQVAIIKFQANVLHVILPVVNVLEIAKINVYYVQMVNI